MNEPLIQFEHFSFRYLAQQEPTLVDISLEIRKGEKLLIAGQSGCGKSTLIHCMNGLIPFSYKGEASGSVRLNGTETSSLSLFDISKTVGTVLQDSDGQFVGLTVAEDIAFALENDEVPTPELHSRVRAVAERVQIADRLEHAPTEISGGQKQRVALAGVMVDDVDVLLFDEPLANLDPATGKRAIELIDEIQKETGVAVVIIEHRLEDVLWRHVDRVVLMAGGRILADESPDELLSGPLLRENGIREPLYLTALKYAGVPVRPEMHPWSIREIRLGEEEKKAVRAWFASVPPRAKEEEKPVLFSCEGLDFSYSNGFHALKGISFSVREGEMIAVAGTNGAGKSTLAKVICGFECEQKGELRFRGEPIRPLSIRERAEHIGYVMQNPNQMISKVMIFDEIALGLRTRKVPEDEIRERVGEVLKICGLWEFRSWPVSALSYGQKKRVTIASILVLRPEILILDEPTAGQDYRHYTEIMEFLLELNRQGITILMITHDMHLMLEYARRSIVLHDGQILADAPASEILTSPGLVSKASLKETSLYTLSALCGIENGQDFVQRFIDFEREGGRA